MRAFCHDAIRSHRKKSFCDDKPVTRVATEQHLRGRHPTLNLTQLAELFRRFALYARTTPIASAGAPVWPVCTVSVLTGS